MIGCPPNGRARNVLFLFLTLILTGCFGGGDDNAPNGATSLSGFYNIDGLILPSGSSAVDSDVNDPNASYASNDTPETAQQLYVPVILAGYLNLAGQGAPGRSTEGGDPADYYRIRLKAGDSIQLYIPNPDTTDMDLYLYRADDLTLVDAALGAGQNESLSIIEDGDYLVEVRLVDDPQMTVNASNYNLNIGSAAGGSDTAGVRLRHDFVPGEILVRVTRDQISSVTELQSILGGKNKGAVLAEGSKERVIRLSFSTGDQTRTLLHTLGLRSSSSKSVSSGFVSEPLRRKLDTLRVIKAMKRRMDIEDAAPNFIRRPFLQPSDTHFDKQWHYDLIHLPEAWDTYTGNDEVVVAVVDTGVLLDHPDLSARLTSDGYDFVSSPDMEGEESDPSDRDGIDPNPYDPGDQAEDGSTFHGTHVAGTIGAHTNNGVGVAGVGWNAARIMPVRALGVGGGTSWDIFQAVRYAAGLSNSSGTVPGKPADIINLSFGGGGLSTIEQSLFDTIRQMGIIVVAAAGNKARDDKSYPAAYDNVVSVSALDQAANLAYYSSFGDTVDVAAPGGDNTADLNGDGYPDGVLSTSGDDAAGTISLVYGFKQGTSMAAPHVAGVAALMKAVWPEMSADDFFDLLRSGAITQDLGAPGKDEIYGYGMIDAQKAVDAVLGGIVPTALIADPAMIDLGNSISTAILNIEKTGSVESPLIVDSLIDDADWLSVESETVDDDGLGTYRVSVARTGLADGAFGGLITIVSSINTVYVPVYMQVGSDDQFADAGHHYVLLLDPETHDALEEVQATLIDGIYHFSFSNVAKGQYLLYAGSDMDNDSVLGDVGNAFGAYISIDQPSVITVDKNASGLNFRTEFNINLFDSQLLCSEESTTRRLGGSGNVESD